MRWPVVRVSWFAGTSRHRLSAVLWKHFRASASPGGCQFRTSALAMEQIEDVHFVECKDSMYVQPSRMCYKQNGKDRAWDLLKVHDSASAVIYNKTRDVLVYVRQFRPAVYHSNVRAEDAVYGKMVDAKKYPARLGMTLELCDGILDKPGLSAVETVQQEILEECGYRVPPGNIEKITSFRSFVGLSGANQELFYAEVTDAMRETSGGGCAAEGEMIEVVELTIPEACRMVTDKSVARPADCAFGTLWFLKVRNGAK